MSRAEYASCVGSGLKGKKFTRDERRLVGRPLTILPKEEIILLYQSGLNCQQIGPIMGVSWATINRRLQAWGIEVRLRWQKGICPFTKEQLTKGNPSRFKGHSHTPESCKKMSISRIGKNTWSKGSEKSPETKRRNSEASKRLWQNPKYRENLTQRMRELWANPDYSNRVRPLILKGNTSHPTKPEKQLSDIIQKRNLPFKYTGDGSFMINGYNPDYVNCNGEKKVIEVFGDYWHGKGAHTWRETELGRIMTFNSFGFKCVIIWEHELKELPEEVIVERILR